MQTDIETIKKSIYEWVNIHIGLNFKFRKYQLESILFIIKSVINDNRENLIIEAPTGSGKSFITIIAAGVLNTYYNLSSYILCSDLFLWQQYKDAIDTYNLEHFGYLKGTQGNYKCAVNGMDFKCGRCQLEKVSFRQLRNPKFVHNNMYTCTYKCEYLQQRFRAERCSVTLMTYQLWLHHMNLVKSDEPSFAKRSIIFCDECHNIPNIVQSFCTPIINPVYDMNMFQGIIKYASENGIEVTNRYVNEFGGTSSGLNFGDDKTFADLYSEEKIYTFLNRIYKQIHDNYESNIVINDIHEYQKFLSLMSNICEQISDQIKSYSTSNAGRLTKTLMSINGKVQWCDNYISAIENFVTAIDNTGPEYVLVEYTKDDNTGEFSYTLNCVKEDYLCHQYLLANSSYKVMMSATVGGHAAFDENMGIKYTKAQNSFIARIPSTFSFDKSPIYYLPQYKMNYANKPTDFPIIQNMLYKVCVAHKSSRGIIHTGSYDNAIYVLRNAPDDVKSRLIIYTTSKQKDEAILKFKQTTNGILIGPTLTEGIDLPDDLCRFMIIIKMPYPNIQSSLVKKKIELFPLWYNSTTSNIIIQSIGRGVRNENDYCTTYIMDGCFTHLYEQTKEQYPEYIQNRIKYLI